MLIVYITTIFTGAALLFVVQPMVGRMVLPLLGGSPAVWSTAMLFYQVVLLAGYAYAHFSTRWLGVRRQVRLHFIILLLPLLVLPVLIPPGWSPPTTQNPVPWLLGLLALTVGLPFFVVSATSPLLQRWFSASQHRAAADPYFLYAASNCGSLLALVGYPALIEPGLRLSQQSQWWTVGYLLLVGLTVACGLWIMRQAGNSGVLASAVSPAVDLVAQPLTVRRRGRWVILACVPCSLMLSVTTHITSEIAPIPLLWVIPLGIYLLAFVLVFAQRPLIPHRWLRAALPVMVTVIAATLIARVGQPIGLLIGLHLAGLFIVSMVCLGELAGDRPAPAHLTEFYLWLAVGGVFGGIVNALVAPVIFSAVVEYPLTLVLACALMSNKPTASSARRGRRVVDFALPLIIGLVAANLLKALRGGTGWPEFVTRLVMYGVPTGMCLFFARQPLRFAVALAAVLVASACVPGYADRTLFVKRNFFGIHRISLDPTGRYHWLMNGNTLHGIQTVDRRWRDEPLAYFTKSGPFGQAFAAVDAALKKRVGVIGLGAGSLAGYGQRGERWTFYEIDPVVEKIARDPRYFTFLQDCPAEVEVVLGDARLSLQQVPDGQYGVLVLDAYTSATIPLHLITREALALYLRKLTPEGVLIFHLSNRHLRLEGVLAVLAQNAGLACVIQSESGGSQGELLATGKMASKWMVLARHPETLAGLTRDSRWQGPPPHLPQKRLWTDDYASVFRVFLW